MKKRIYLFGLMLVSLCFNALGLTLGNATLLIDGVYYYAYKRTITINDVSQFAAIYIDGVRVDHTDGWWYPGHVYTIPDKYADGLEHTFRVSNSSVKFTIVNSSVGDFAADNIQYKITSNSNLEVVCLSAFGAKGDVVIPSSVNFNNRTYSVIGINEMCFAGNHNIISVSIPESVITISNRAFADCKNLKTVIGGANVETIGKQAFWNCRNLDSFEFGPQVTNIGESAFIGCTNLQNIKFPEAGSIKIRAQAFSGCTALASATLTDAVKSIGSDAFEGCSALNRVILGENVRSIGSSAFASCPKLIEVFFTGSKPDVSIASAFAGTHSGIEYYVPSVADYGFGICYASFEQSQFAYDGKPHFIEAKNNLRAYKCAFEGSETEINAGNYTEPVIAHYSDGLDLTVKLPFAYEIAKAPMSLTVNDASREFGDPNPAFTCSISGFVNGENEQMLGVTPEFECEATPRSKVGTYRILASIAADNYDITYKYGTLTVEEAPLSLKVADLSKIYGDPNPQPEYNCVGLKNGETKPTWSVAPTVTTPATEKSDAGTYPITVTGGQVANYKITEISEGVLAITKRDLDAKADDCKRLYGTENPKFTITYSGFVNGDGVSALETKPAAECAATIDSDAGTYPITVSGGSAKNYNVVGVEGTLTIRPQTVGFKEVYNSVDYDDMSLSTNDRYFNFIPEIVGPFSAEDFWIDLWFLDKDLIYTDHVATIAGGEYAGKYVNTNIERPTDAGKYIFNLTPKGKNPNVVANPSRAYLTVNRASNELDWSKPSPIVVGINETIDLGINYKADLWCEFTTDYDESLITIKANDSQSNNPKWTVTGLKEGETTMKFSISCKANEMGFYNFTDSPRVSKTIRVVPYSGIDEITSECDVNVIASRGKITIVNKSEGAVCRVFALNGEKVAETTDNEIGGLSAGLYVVVVDSKTFKVAVK